MIAPNSWSLLLDVVIQLSEKTLVALETLLEIHLQI